MNDNNLNKSENTLTLSKYISKMQSETRDIYINIWLMMQMMIK